MGRDQRLVVGLTLGIGLFTFLLYINTLAQYPLFGDPTEYTYVAHVLGIAHPPGYAFMTILHKLFQTIVPFGTVAWRSHLVSALVGAGMVTAVFVMIRALLSYAAEQIGYTLRPNLPLLAGLLTAVGVGTSVNFWQHAIHANPHIITAGFLAVNLCLLTLWGVRQRAQPEAEPKASAYLFIFSLLAGLGVVHHPLTIFAFPAYAVFILWVRPSIWRAWRIWLPMLGFAALGLALFLYYPWRSGMNPAVGPTSMNTLGGFLDHVLARGLAESLPYFSLAELPLRQITYLSILRLQYVIPLLVLAVIGWPRCGL